MKLLLCAWFAQHHRAGQRFMNEMKWYDLIAPHTQNVLTILRNDVFLMNYIIFVVILCFLFFIVTAFLLLVLGFYSNSELITLQNIIKISKLQSSCDVSNAHFMCWKQDNWKTMNSQKALSLAKHTDSLSNQSIWTFFHMILFQE